MKPTASQIRQVVHNHQLPARTMDARIKAILAHMQVIKKRNPAGGGASGRLGRQELMSSPNTRESTCR